jgi:PPOX class probable F420-dependent enzyme
MTWIPDSHIDLVSNEKKAFAFLGTTMHDNSPQVTPIWFNVKDNKIWINSAKGRIKDQNIRRHPYVALAIPDPSDTYRYIQIRGKVVEIREKGADDHITELSIKYKGKPYSLTPGQVRVIYIIEPDSVFAND